MPECRLTSHLPIILSQILPAERRTLLRFSLLSALAHIAALTIFVIWSGGRARFQPPLQEITINLGNMQQPQQRALPRVVGPRHQKPALRLPAPAQAQPAAAVKPQPAASPSQPTQTAAVAAATTDSSQRPTPGVQSGAVAAATAAATAPSGTATAAVSPIFTSPPSVANAIRAADKAGIRAGYMQRCRTLIERHKQYPVMARKGMIEGTVLIRGTLARDGILRQCIITRSSGSGLLDNAALRAVRSVEQFPPLPSELSGGELVFELPVSFRLSAE